MMRKLKFELKHDFKKETEKKPAKKLNLTSLLECQKLLEKKS